MKKLKYLIFAILLNITIISVNAASGTFSITASNTSVEVGQTTSVTIMCKSTSAIGACEYSLNYDSSKLKLISGDEAKTLLLDSKDTKMLKTTVRFKVIDTGSSKVTFKTYEIYDYNEKPMATTISSTTIKGTSPSDNNKTDNKTYSTNNFLKSLSIDGIKLSPTFNKNTLKYTVALDSSTKKATVKAIPQDDKSTVTGNKTYKLSLGINNIKVVVTSEKGTKRTYEISINIEDKNPIKIPINNEIYTVIKQKDSLPLLDNYKEKEIELENIKIPALYSDITKYTLVGLKSPTGKINLFIYDEKTNTYQIYQEIEFNNIKIIPLETNNKIKGYIKTKVTINDQEVYGYKMYAASNYTIIFGINPETGEKTWYSYEKTENTIQKFANTELSILNNDQDKSNQLIKLLGSVIIILAMLIILVASKKKRKIKKIKTTTNESQQEEKKEEIIVTKIDNEQIKQKKEKKTDKENEKLLDEW